MQAARARKRAVSRSSAAEVPAAAFPAEPGSAGRPRAAVPTWSVCVGTAAPPAVRSSRFFRPARLLSAPEYSLMDEYGFFRGQTFSFQTLFPAVMQVDLSQLGRDFRVPIFFFEGRNDPFCRPSLVWDYSQQMAAPQKAFIWFDHSGHFPFFEEQQKFTDELVHQVLPLANAAQAGN